MIVLLCVVLVCATVVYCVERFIRSGIFTYRYDYSYHEHHDSDAPASTIGFETPEAESQEEAGAEAKPLSDRELREAIMRDAATTITTLMRGEVDFDEFRS